MSLMPLGLLSQGGGAGNGGNALTLISTTVLGSAAASVTFSSIVGTYKHLQLRITARGSRSAALDGIDLNFNSDTGFNYSNHRLLGNGSTVSSSNGSSLSYMSVASITGSTATTDAFGSCVIDILDYGSTAKNKTVKSLGGYINTGSAGDSAIHLRSGAWYSTSAVTAITLVSSYGTNFLTGSRFSLFGVS